jgi:hypothetical protein
MDLIPWMAFCMFCLFFYAFKTIMYGTFQNKNYWNTFYWILFSRSDIIFLSNYFRVIDVHERDYERFIMCQSKWTLFPEWPSVCFVCFFMPCTKHLNNIHWQFYIFLCTYQATSTKGHSFYGLVRGDGLVRRDGLVRGKTTVYCQFNHPILKI